MPETVGTVQIKDKSAIMAVEPIAVGVSTAANLMGVSTGTMNEWVHMEGFPSFKIGGRMLVSVEGLREWVKARISLEPRTATTLNY